MEIIICLLFSFAPLANLPPNSYIYEEVDALKTGGIITSSIPTSRPWLWREAKGYYEETEGKGTKHGRLRLALRNLKREFSNPPKPCLRYRFEEGEIAHNWFSRVRHDTGNTAFSLGTTFNNGWEERFALHTRMEFSVYRKKVADIIDSAGKHIPGLPVHSWMGIASMVIDEASFNFKIPWLILNIGRGALFFGPSNENSVILSHSAPSLDMIRLSGTYRRFKLLSFTSALSRWGRFLRFLSGQRLEWSPFNSLRFGTTLFACHSPDSAQTKSFFGLVNPLIPLYFEVANSGHDDNLLVGGDLVLYLPLTKLYGQLLLDNFEFVPKKSVPPERRPPNCYGVNLGIYRLLPLDCDFLAEWTLISPYTYYHRIYHIAFTHYGVPLGDPLGPDARRLHLKLGFYPQGLFGLSLKWTRVERGEFNEGDYQKRTWEEGEIGNPPFSLQSKTNLYLLGFKAYPLPLCQISFDFGIASEERRNPEAKEKKPVFFLKLAYRY